MIDRQQLLAACQKQVKRLTEDLRARCEEDASLEQPLKDEHRAARAAGRTADAYKTWREAQLSQIASAWVLAVVFVRFLEDNELTDEPMIAGPGARNTRARERIDDHFQRSPIHTEREYLLATFEELSRLPGLCGIFDRRHNPLFRLGPSAEAARELIDLFRGIDPETGTLRFDFTDPGWDTRFLGDLYQDLSEDVRKRYALLQTPDFVESFILDRTLNPAIDTFGYEAVRLIDPTCGSGHFLLGAFERLIDLHARHAPGVPVFERVQKVLDQVYGVDINPYAVGIARFRLLLAALRAAGETRLRQAPNFTPRVATGDSLLHGMRFGFTAEPTARQGQLPSDEDALAGHHYAAEDEQELSTILGQQYHAVVGNPPYITVSDTATNSAYRSRYRSCHGPYQLVAPFMERFFELAVDGRNGDADRAGFVGMIVSNAFAKREFGKTLIEKILPQWDVSQLVDTSGAYIPHHGTPTLILFGRHRKPVTSRIRAVLGIRGEPKTPHNPDNGLVWASILSSVDRVGAENEYVSTEEIPLSEIGEHPWILTGGGARDLKKTLDRNRAYSLKDKIVELGRSTHTGEDEVYYRLRSQAETAGLRKHCVPLIKGEDVRDYRLDNSVVTVFPYDQRTAEPITDLPDDLAIFFWRYRALLRRRRDYGKTIEQRGHIWYEHSMFFPRRYRTARSIAFAFVATHNHFVLDRGGKVFKQSAPVIKLPPEASEDDHLALLGLLNSSTACFWMKMVMYCKGEGGQGGGMEREEWMRSWEIDGTKLQKFPVVADAPLGLARKLDGLAQERQEQDPKKVLERGGSPSEDLERAKEDDQRLREQMIAWQEELDWRCYRLYGVTEDDLTYDGDPPRVRLGERAFEIALARKVDEGQVETTWFDDHGSTPITAIPADWPESYRKVVQRRLDAMEQNRWIALVEKPEYKRRWNEEPWDKRQQRALREWLLDRLEDESIWRQGEPQLRSVRQLADLAMTDPRFVEVAELYDPQRSGDVVSLVKELVLDEAVPFLPRLRYREPGLRKHEEWKRTWDLQRQEDALDARTELPEDDPNHLTESQARRLKREQGLDDIPVPPKYKQSDFAKPSYWRLRGKLDVPKERFVLFPGAEREADPLPVVAWAGYDHAEQARALGAYYQARRYQDGWEAERCRPLLEGLAELLPWLEQWHDDPSAPHGRLGEFFRGFVNSEASKLGLTLQPTTS